MGELGEVRARNQPQSVVVHNPARVYYPFIAGASPRAQDSDGSYSCRIAVLGDPQSDLGLADFRKALAKLPPKQRETLAVSSSAIPYRS